MVYQTPEELRKELVQPSRSFTTSEVKPLSQKLTEMGFDKNTFMAVKYEAKVGERIEQNGAVNPSPYLSFGPEHRGPSGNGRTDGELNDEYIGASIGGVGSNNGIYSAMSKHGNEIIITQDPKIHEALISLGFKRDAIGVPMSNGGVFADYKMQQEYDSMKFACARKADREGQEKRTAAVQRGDIITTYDPNDKDSNGLYRNVRHYEKSDDGHLVSISMEKASAKLQEQTQYGANTAQSISRGKNLDGAEVGSMLSNSWINYRGR